MATKKNTKRTTKKTTDSTKKAGIGEQEKPRTKAKDNFCTRGKGDCTTGGCGYFIGVIGAAVYYLSTTTGFWNGVWGLIKAFLWPAFLVHGLLKFIGA